MRSSPEAFGQWVGGGTLMLRADDLRALGGWSPTPNAVDLLLLHSLRDAGGGIYRTHALGFMLCRHNHGHTWSQEDEAFLATAAEQWEGYHPSPELAHSLVAEDVVRVLRHLPARPIEA